MALGVGAKATNMHIRWSSHEPQAPTLHLWLISTLLQELHEHKGPVTDLDWSQDSSLLLSVSEDCHAALWNASLGSLVRTLRY